jgi:hypothetical protein
LEEQDGDVLRRLDLAECIKGRLLSDVESGLRLVLGV